MAAIATRQEFGVMKHLPQESQPRWSARKELELLAKAGLGEWSRRLAAVPRHAIILEPPVGEGADAPVVGGLSSTPCRT
jgi:hypothetical protein